MQEVSKSELIKMWEEHRVFAEVEDEDEADSPIRSICFDDTKDTDSLCQYIPLAPQVEEVSFRRSDVTAKGFAYLRGLPNLQGVFFENTEVAGTGFKVLTTLPGLRRLDCSPRHETREALFWIGQLANLTNLGIFDSGIVDADLSALSQLSDLTHLDLTNNHVDIGLSVVAQLPKLKWLVLSFTKISTKTLETVRLAKSVRKMFLDGVSVDNEGLAQIAEMKNLTYLYFVGDQIDTNGVKHLANLKQLEDLHIDDLTIAPEMVAEFGKMKQLKLLRTRSDADPAIRKAIKRALLRCDVSFFDP
jgi:Leucine-rich repeat (LRR) protein